MKNKMGTMALTGVLAFTTAFSMTAFAEDKKPATPVQGGSSIIQGDLATTDIAPTADTLPNYVTTTGKIDNITKDGENYTISVTNDDMGMVFNVKSDVFVINRKDNSYMKLSDLKKGMEITGIVRGNSPQTMSLPPQTPGAIGFVANSGEGMTSVGHFDAELTNTVEKLKLNMDDKVTIVDQKGSKKILKADDLKDQDLVVFYGATTRSIPAQTTPSFVMLLDAPVAPEADTEIAPKEAPKEATEAPDTIPLTEITPSTKVEAPVVREMVALRATAEAAGYTVKWTANDQPVVLEKGGVSVSVTIGQDSFSKNGEAMKASDATVLRDAQIFIAADVADALK